MYVSRIRIANWRNFTKADIDLSEITYLLGPNASGKSNLLDVFRFLRDLAKPHGGGLQHSIKLRGGLSKVRSLAARKNPNIEIEIEFRKTLEKRNGPPDWRYVLGIKSEPRGHRRPIVEKEIVYSNGKKMLNRPDTSDINDPERLTQTHLEQTNMNSKFREIAGFLQQVLYLHLVPQLLKFGNQVSLSSVEEDPFGQQFLEEIAKSQKRTRDSRLKRIEKTLKMVVPNFEQLKFKRDEKDGRPHLEMLYNHWRPNAGWQREDQFSDGTLRLIALIWTLLSSNSLILLEEPEISLHKRIVEQIPALITLARKSRKAAGGQIFISTHSEALLSNQALGADYLVLQPGQSGEATTIEKPSATDIIALQSGLTPADVLLPKTSSAVGDI